MAMKWRKGPLPPNTHGQGAVYPAVPSRYGYEFCEFKGDCAVTTDGVLVLAADVKQYLIVEEVSHDNQET